MTDDDNREDRHDLDAMLDREMERLGPAGHAIATQLTRLKDRLYALPGFAEAIATVHDDLIDAGWRIDPDGTGEIDTWLVIGEGTYRLTGSGELRVQRKVAGRTEWAEVKPSGDLGPWHLASPSPAQSSMN